MEFNFNCEDALSSDIKGFSIIEGSFENNIAQIYRLHVKGIIDLLGESSSKEQGLNVIKTNSHKFFTSNDRIFLKCDKNIVLGFLRVGKRHMKIKDEKNNYSDDHPLCVIDFYVPKQYERQGVGKAIFDKMLYFEKVQPGELCYDRLTPKMIKFLNKHFALKEYIIQNNGFSVYMNYFELKNNKKKLLRDYAQSHICKLSIIIIS